MGSNDPSLFFGDPVEFERMKDHRDLPFVYQGQKVEVDGKPGIITGTTGGFNLAVKFENSFKTDSNCHPYWKVKYFGPDGSVVSEFKD